MGLFRTIEIKNVAVADSGVTEVPLPRSTVYRELFLVFTITVAIGTNPAVLHEDSLSAWIKRVAITSQGLPSPFDMDGYSAKVLSEFQAASSLIADVAPVTVNAAATLTLYLPITFLSRDANNEYVTLYDARGLPELNLRIETNAFAGSAMTAGGGGTLVFTSATLDVVADVWDTADAVAGVTAETRRVLVGGTQVSTGPGGVLQFDLLKGGLFRSALMIARTAAAPGGSRTNTRPTNVSIRRGINDMVVDRVPWTTGQLRGIFSRNFTPPTGVLYFSLDPEGTVKPDAMLDTARIPSLQETLDLETEISAANVVWSIVPEYLVRRG